MRNFILLMCCIVLINCDKEVNNPPGAPKIQGPSIGYADSTYPLSATATDPDGDSIAIRFSWGDGDTSIWSLYLQSGDTVEISHSYSDSGRYSISAQAMDVNDAVSDWSAIHSIRILLAGANNYPDVPGEPIGPSAGKVDSVYLFTSSATDPDEDSVAIRFSWGDGDTSTWSDYVPSGQAVSDSHSYDSIGIYYVRAQAKDLYGALSSWSSIHPIYIVTNYPPNIPSIPSGPSSGWVDSTYAFFSSGTDPDDDSISIRFSWGDGDTSTWSLYVPVNDTIVMNHFWSSPGTYNIRAQAKDPHNATSGWSEPHQIVISSGVNNPPNKPTTPSGPQNGWIDSIYVFFSSAIDPNGDSITIRFSWGDGDTSTWSDYYQSGSTIAGAHSWQFARRYYIKAQARDRLGLSSDWSDSVHIDIQ